jgi:hypothetical protein
MSAEFNPNDPFEMMRNFWQNAAGTAAKAMMPPITEEEVDRKLAELKVIEAWLTMNMGMLSLQIKTLEMQKAAITAIKSGKKEG